MLTITMIQVVELSDPIKFSCTITLTIGIISMRLEMV